MLVVETSSNAIVVIENSHRQKIAISSNGTNDDMVKDILEKGVYDKAGLYYIEKILSKLKNPVVFDIGANIGNHALIMAKYCQMVYLFEPQEKNADLLRNTLSLNNIKNWKIFNFGLSDAEENLSFYINLDGNNGASTFVSELKSNNSAIENLPVYKGDDIINSHSIQQLDFVKIDVEGFEGKVIHGLQEAIKKFLPIIMIEWNNETTRNQFKELDLLHTVLGDYIAKTVINNHHKSLWHGKKFAKIRRIFREIFTKKRASLGKFVESFGYSNVIFIPKEKSHLFVNL